MLKIVWTNLRKRKSSGIILCVFTVLAAAFLCIGITIVSQLGSVYSDKIEALKSPYIAYFIQTEEQDRFIEEAFDYEGICTSEVESALYASGVEIRHGNSEAINGQYIFFDMAFDRNTSVLDIIDSSNIEGEDAIILPYMYKNNYDYVTGDIIEIAIKDKLYTYRVAGFFEDVIFGSPAIGIGKLYVNKNQYEATSTSTIEGQMLSIRTKDKSMIEGYVTYISKLLNNWDAPLVQVSGDIEIAETAVLIFINILAAIILAFSLIMIVIVLIVIGFSIVTSIEDDMTSIGILKATGYKNSQIVKTILIQYMLICILGSAIGAILTRAALPTVSELLSSSAGMRWTLEFHGSVALLSSLIIMMLTAIIACIYALKIQKITPVMALRQGVATHNFTKNHFPMDKGRGNIVSRLILKTIAGNSKNNWMIWIIVTILTFACIFSSIMYYNMAENNSAIINTVGLEACALTVEFSDTVSEEVTTEAFTNIQNMLGVTHILMTDSREISTEAFSNVGLLMYDNFDSLLKKTLVEGRYPLYDNEIVISSVIAKREQRLVGDIMTVTNNGASMEYLITGITQQITRLGMIMEMTNDGYRHIEPDYSSKTAFIYLEDGIDREAFIETVTEMLGETDHEIVNITLMIDNIIGSFQDGVGALMWVMILITLLVVCMILYMLIRIRIIREKVNLGIAKAIGFTNRQLIQQMSMSMVVIIGFGAITGSVLGSLFSNQFTALMLSGIGIKYTEFVTNYTYVVMITLCIFLISMLMAYLSAGRIKKVTPYNLIVE